MADPRDGKTKERLHKLSEDKGMWDCCHCFEATEHCPKGIDPTERIFALRNRAIKEGARELHCAEPLQELRRLGQGRRLAG